MWFVYILRCENGDFYTGVSDNVERRLKEHPSGKGGRFTKISGAKDFLFVEKHLNKVSAFKREAQIKRWTRRKKIALMQGNFELLKKL